MPSPARIAASLTPFALIAPLAASALDFSQARAPAAIADAQVGIGERMIRLPPGDWSFVSYTAPESAAPGTAPAHTGFFADVRGGAYRLGMVVQMPVQATASRGTAPDPCKADGALYRSTLAGSEASPECIIVNRREAFLAAPSGSFWTPVKDWLVNNGHTLSASVYEIDYSRQADTGTGRLRLFVPVGAFADDRAAVAWAEALPSRFREFFEERVAAAELPALP